MSGDHLPKLSMSSSSFGGSTQSINANSNSNTNATNALSASKQINSLTIATTNASITNNHRYVKLNVGGRLFSTSLDTLTKQDNMLRAMFSGRLDVLTDLDGYILIDRSGKHFEFILNYLRDEDSQMVNMNLDELKSELELYEVLKEAKFYCIQPLANLIEQKIILNKSLSACEPYLGSSIVSMITSKSDLVKILTSTDKPCIRLLINRHNNKYSYTNTSDDNLIKNIELFERMAIKFKNRIMFIKDTTSNEEICCWYFHGGAKKLAEVCCTSIVYTTEKKQTKVEFPDSKILEEIFVNAVLFESKETNNSSENSTGNNQLNLYQNSADDENYEDMPRINLLSSNQSNGSNLNALVNPNGTTNLIVSSAISAVSGAINNVNLNSANINSSSGSSSSSQNSAGTNIVASSSSVINPSNIISIASSIAGNGRRAGGGVR